MASTSATRSEELDIRNCRSAAIRPGVQIAENVYPLTTYSAA